MAKGILGFLFGILVGVLGTSFAVFPKTFLLILFCVSFGIFFILLLKNKKSQVILCGCFLIGISLGGLRYLYKEEVFKNSELFNFEGKQVEIVGVVNTDPSVGEKNSKAIIKINSLDNNILNQEKILLSFNPITNISYGDEIKVKGKLTKIKNFGDGKFDYVSYEKKDSIQFQIQFAEIQKTGKFSGNNLLKTLFGIKSYFENNISKFLSEPGASLVSGMVVSGKNSLPQSVKDSFIKVGLIHIVVLSGYNIALVISFVSQILRGFSLKIRTSLSVIFVLLFVLMAGASAPIIRSAITAYIALSGKLFFRKVRQNRALLFVCSLMVFINPYILVFDPSFALTFLATFAIINVAPLVTEKLSFVTERFGFREILSQTLAVELLVTPYLLYKMGTISLIAPVANILAIPFIPYITLLGIILGILGFLGFLLYPIAVLLNIFVFWIFLVSKLGNLPGAFLNIGNFPFWLCIFLYAIITYGLFRIHKKVATPI